MFGNRLNLIQIFGIMMLGISLSLLIMAWGMHGEAYRYDYHIDEGSLWARNSFITGSLLIMAPAFGLFARKKWAVVFFIVLFWIAIIAWAGIFMLAINNRYRGSTEETIVLAGFSILIVAALLAGILYLDNVHVLEAVDDKAAKNDTLPDILDQ